MYTKYTAINGFDEKILHDIHWQKEWFTVNYPNLQAPHQ